MKRAPIVLLVALSACGTVPGLDYKTVLAEWHATSATPYDGTPRAAIVWKQETSVTFAQEVGLQADVDDGFSLIVTEPPPLGALTQQPTTAGGCDGAATACTWGASGYLVVYEDTNGNGKADLIPVDATDASIDRVLGVSKGTLIEFVEGPNTGHSRPLQVGTVTFATTTIGFNLVDIDVPPPTASCLGNPAHCCDGQQGAVVPSSTELEIDLTGDPSLGRYLCDGSTSPTDVSNSCITARYTPSDASNGDLTITCAPDNRSWIGTSCVHDDGGPDGLCLSGMSCLYDVSYLDASDSVPADWPCPAAS